MWTLGLKLKSSYLCNRHFTDCIIFPALVIQFLLSLENPDLFWELAASAPWRMRVISKSFREELPKSVAIKQTS